MGFQFCEWVFNQISCNVGVKVPKGYKLSLSTGDPMPNEKRVLALCLFGRYQFQKIFELGDKSRGEYLICSKLCTSSNKLKYGQTRFTPFATTLI